MAIMSTSTATFTNMGSGRVKITFTNSQGEIVLDQVSTLADALRYVGANLTYEHAGIIDWPVGLPERN